MAHENPPKRCRGETENGRESGCRNRKRRGRKSDTHTVVDADSGQQRQPGSQVKSRGERRMLGGGRGGGGGGFQGGSRESISSLTRPINGFRGDNHWSPTI